MPFATPPPPPPPTPRTPQSKFTYWWEHRSPGWLRFFDGLLLVGCFGLIRLLIYLVQLYALR